MGTQDQTEIDSTPSTESQGQNTEAAQQNDSLPSEETSEKIQVNKEVKPIQDELTSNKEELHSLNDKYLRLAAEFENYKRRANRDQKDTANYANERLLKDLLPTIDTLEQALHCGHEQPSLDSLLQGVKLTLKQFLDTLAKLGVSQISSVGEQFDPTKHQAVAQVESTTVPPNSVVEEYQKGYFLHNRILRPAMVTVAMAKPEQGPTSKEDHASEEGGENT